MPVTADVTAATDFTVPAGTFVIVGDSRPRDYLEFLLEDSDHVAPLVFGAIAGENPVCVIHAGDLAVFGSRKSFWKGWAAFDRDVALLAARGIRVFPVVGNHEYRGYTRTPLEMFFSRFEHLGRRNHYTIRIGGVLVVCIDTNLSRMGSERVQAQDRWLDAVLGAAAADAAIRLVLPVVHHPPFTNVSRRYLVFESAEVQERFVPRFVGCAKVGAVVSGHVHTYERILHDGIQFIVTGGGGSPRFKLKPPRNRRRVDLFTAGDSVRPFHYLRCAADAAGRGLTVDMLAMQADGSWRIGERFEIAPRTQ